MATRDFRLDTLRGVFLAIMMIDHLGTRMAEFTYQPFGFVSAAAAFVMLSGYMNAFTSPAAYPGLRALLRQAWKRASRVYRYHFVLLLALLALAVFMTAYLQRPTPLYPERGGALGMLAYGALLLHQPSYMDILPMYFLFLLLSPPLLAALHRGHDWLVIGGSVACWFLGQVLDPQEWLEASLGTGVSTGSFNLLAWQLLWVTGLYAGFLHKVRRQTAFFHHRALLWMALAIAAGFFLVRHQLLPVSDAFLAHVEKEDLRILRVANIASQVVLFCWLIRLVPASRGLPWFRLLGRYSLPVFSFHILLVYLLEPLSWRVAYWFGYSVNFLYTAAVLATLTLPALFYRAYEQALAAGGPRTWAGRLHAAVLAGRHPFSGAKPARALDAK
ncbi:OpgC domain-containing protein [Noviherbaspirillum sp. 1P10PC]|uniref:OpgC domain-containing protein n=1 Tax=Noviherbaspirillum sp. 1P10PC TaxID=3132292 RepID=UPI0039A2AE4C